MQFSFQIPNADYLGFSATPDAIVTAAQQAERLGYDALLLNDHLIINGAADVVASWGNVFEPLTTMAFLAAQTDRIKLATSVLIMPYRNPILTAKTVAMLDPFSSGRIILGIGAGWVKNEFDALAINFADRGRSTDEYLRVYRACWGPDPISYPAPFTNSKICILLPNRCRNRTHRYGSAARPGRPYAGPQNLPQSGSLYQRLC